MAFLDQIFMQYLGEYGWNQPKGADSRQRRGSSIR